MQLPGWEKDNILSRHEEHQDMDDHESVYTDTGVTSLLNESQIKFSLTRMLSGLEEDLYQEVNEKTKTMNMWFLYRWFDF